MMQSRVGGLSVPGRFLFLFLLAIGFSAAWLEAAPAYKNPNLPVEERVRDLLGRMTLAEKARQLDMYAGCNTLLSKNDLIDRTHAKPDAPFDPQKAEAAFGHLGVGSIHDLYPSPKLYNEIQAWVSKSNRLGIPALFIEEGLHGYLAYDETIFPQSVNLACTWNPKLARETGAAIASEARADGVDMILAPVLDVARDPRWGRVEEDFGEDPFLSGQMGLAYVEGMQGDSLATDHTCTAEPKHFAGYGAPESGLNTSPTHAGEREMRTILLKSFEPAVREGHAMGIMAAYNEVDGIPCTANPWLLDTVLRGEWGFQGFVLTDLGAVRRLWDAHHVAATPADAVCLALNSGVDMQFYDFDHATFQNAVMDGLKDGRISEATLDAAVSRILRVKFLLGLFDHPFVDESLDRRVRRSPAHLALSLEVARQSLCLLKNDDHLLPLKKDLRCIAVIGPNANVTQLGDYATKDHTGPDEGMVEQIKKLVSPRTQVLFADGENIDQAVAVARQADVVVMGLGEKHGISGEGFDRSELGLPGNQEELLEAVAKTGVPVVLVLENGRALAIPWAAAHVPAILEAWYPGEFGGRAIAETLFGDNNPAGRLDVSFPKRVGQLPVYYNHFPSKRNDYVDGDDSPQFVFGYGLSYTSFKYGRLTVTPPPPGSSADILVSFDLTNTGGRDGDEVAQLYTRETTASVATPARALNGFARVHLRAGETRRLTLHLKQADLAVWGADRKWELEPGEFTVWVGGSSAASLSATFTLGR
ncbi:MAG: glycoside hydrolase family 3 C-terminal domain-containing protein [Verrucomicrobiota bacterium]|nr:glycoside hydrolase family 3 C-terminal domain-containing protein [Verrucomicrobiota bacterium]